jgi:alanyl-tRNA synthetase
VEAVTGRGALQAMQTTRGRLEETSAILGVPVDEAPARALRLQEELREAQQEIENLNRKLARSNFQSLLDEVTDIEGIPVLAAQVDAPDAGTLREMADWFRDRMQGGVIVLGTVSSGKPLLIAATTKELARTRNVHAGNLVRQLAQMVGGGGGGRPDMAQAGGSDADKLPHALSHVPDLLREMIA